MSPEALSVLALIISVLAAGFTGWQAFSAHGARRDARHVELLLVSNPRTASGPVHREVPWTLENAGEGTAISPQIVVSFHFEGHEHSYTARVDGTIDPHSRQAINFDKEPPQPTSTIQGTEEKVRDHLTASVSYGRPGKRGQVRRDLPIA